MKKGILVIVSGFSGAGKGTVTKELVKRYDNYALSISATSRAPRPGEVDGKDYFFKTREEFEQMITEDAFLEHAVYVDNYYGTPRQYVLDRLNEGKDVILEIEVQGALQVKEKMPDAVTVFMTTPSVPILRDRLTSRGTETQEKIRKRLLQAKTEAGLMERYDYVVVNDDLEECVVWLHELILHQHSLTSQNKELIAELQKQFEEI